MKKSILTIIFLIIILGLVYFFLENNKSNEELEKVTVRLKWLHQAQFSGFYTALEKGYYEDEGLDVNFEESDFAKEPTDIVLAGEAEFGVDDPARILTKISEGNKLKAISVIFQISPLGYVTLKDSGIKKPQDFVGKNIGLTPDAPTIHSTLMNRLNIKGQMNIIDAGFDFHPLLDGTYDAFTMYVTDEIYKIEEEGYEVNTIMPYDYDVIFYADTIFTTDNIIDSNPELVEKFLRATLRGWQYAIEHEDYVLKILPKYESGRYKDKDYEEYIFNHQRPLIYTGDNEIGDMDEKKWEEMYNTLLEYGEIKNTFNIKEAYSMEFLDKILR